MDPNFTKCFAIIICFISGTSCVLFTDKPKNDDAAVTEFEEGENEFSPSSSSDFAYLRKHSTAFVDKTHMIEKLRLHGRIILTAPRHFGKSINLSMLKYFYEIEISKETAEPVTKSDIQKNPVTDTENYKLFQNLAINRQRPDFMKSQFGRYPVILLDLSLKNTIKFNTTEAISNHFKAAMHQAYKQHWYLMNSTKLTSHEKERCRKWCDDNEYLEIALSYYDCIPELARYLNKHFNRGVIFLVDEYDALYRAIIDYRYDLMRRCREFYNTIFSDISSEKFRSDDDVKHAVLTGISHLAIEDTILEIFPVYRFLRDNCNSRKFAALFYFHGFTQKEFDWLMKKHNISTDMKQQAARYYGGYCSLDGKKNLYTPSSVARFLETKKLKAYWSSTKFFETYGHLMDSINIDWLIKKFIFGVRLPFIDLIGKHSGDFDHQMGHYFTYLFEEGFLTTIEHDDYRYRYANDGENSVLPILANKEIRISIVSELKKYYKTSGHFDWESMKSCSEYFDNINFTDENACLEDLLKIYKSMETYLNNYYSKYPQYLRSSGFFRWLILMDDHQRQELYLRLLILDILCMTKYKIRINKPLINKTEADIFMKSDKGCIMIQVKFVHSYDRGDQEALNYLVKNQVQNETNKCILIGIQENEGNNFSFSMSATVNHREYFILPDIRVKKSFA